MSRVVNASANEETSSAADTQRALANNAADLGTWDIDLAAGTAFWSEQTRKLFGLSTSSPVTQQDLLERIHSEDRPRVERDFQKSLDTSLRAVHDVEFRVIGRDDGVLRWIAAKGRAYFDAEGRAARCVGTYVDITKRKESERHQSCLLELGDRLRQLDSTADIVGAAAEVLGRALCCARAGYAVILGDYAFVEADWTDGEAVSTPGPRPFAVLGEAFCAPLRAGIHHAIPDVATNPLTQHNTQAFHRVRIGALINVPLMENGVLSAIAYAQHTTPHRWTEQEVQLVKAVADRTWEARGRAVAIQALRKVNASLEEQISLRTAQRDRIWRLSSDVLVFADMEGNIQSVNPTWSRIFGWEEHELSSRNLLDLSHSEDRAAVKAALEIVSKRHSMSSFESRCLCRNGNYRRISWRAVPDGNSIQAAGRDITSDHEQAEALRLAEEALRQSQKMEAVGQLTGGIAHDFNNLLQGITGSLDLMEKRLSTGRVGDSLKLLAAARKSANRASALTHRLLAFSRRQPLDPQPVDANTLIVSMKDLMRQTMGELIEIRLSLSPALWPILCDPNQLENAILNLAINARDAMPDGGKLLIETSNLHSDVVNETNPSAVSAADWIDLTMTDTGIGMPASVQEKVFEPFYTTKPLGQGTGLGLSMVYGFMKQSDGYVRLDSEVGIGTKIALHFPRYQGTIVAAKRRSPVVLAGPLANQATVLVVEDEEQVRNLVIEVLSDLGVNVIGAANGTDGLAVLQSEQTVDLLITDIGLPGLNGRQMAEAALERRPTLKVLMMTGYAEIATTNSEILPHNMQMIAKPFSIDLLTQRLREMLS